MKSKHPSSFRFSDEEKRWLKQLAERLNISERAVLAIAIRLLAKREGLM
jgi:predicted transcriptional regulator